MPQAVYVSSVFPMRPFYSPAHCPDTMRFHLHDIAASERCRSAFSPRPPQRIMTGGNIQIEKSKIQMITEDIAETIGLIGA